MKSRAHTTWEGNLARGSGITSLGGGAAGPLPVSWTARTEEQGDNTNPEELIAAAHASCYCMALSNGLTEAGTPPTKLETEAVCTFGQTDEGFKITEIAITVRGQVENISEADFIEAAEGAKEGCPVSQALKGNVAITLDAALA